MGTPVAASLRAMTRDYLLIVNNFSFATTFDQAKSFFARREQVAAAYIQRSLAQ